MVRACIFACCIPKAEADAIEARLNCAPTYSFDIALHLIREKGGETDSARA